MLQVDRLYEAVAEKSPVCVGLDTDFSYIPAECVDKTLSKGENIFRFNWDIIEATRSVAGSVSYTHLTLPTTPYV